jgi:hypothetical protein
MPWITPVAVSSLRSSSPDNTIPRFARVWVSAGVWFTKLKRS